MSRIRPRALGLSLSRGGAASRGRLVLLVLLAGGCVAIAAAATLLLGGGLWLGSSGRAALSPGVPTASALVVRTDIIERQQVAGTLDFRGSFAVADAGSGGVITWLPDGGTIIRRGGPVFELNQQPVPLLYGARPAYRDFTLGMTAGEDVAELQRNLLAFGLGNHGALSPSGHFDLATLAAIEDWQRALGRPPTGTIPLGSAVFLPGAIRVSSIATSLGTPIAAGDPILSATTPVPAVLVPLDPGSVAQIKVGDRVIVTMPDSTTASGRVAMIGGVATASSASSGATGQGPSTATIPITITLSDPRTKSRLDQAPVQVAITAEAAHDVLAVPISALLARPGGRYAIRLTRGSTSRLVTVSIGLFDDVAGLVQVTGAGLAPGMRVEVPAS